MKKDQWMSDGVWILLFLFAPPVWMVLIVLRFLPELIVATLGLMGVIIVMQMFGVLLRPY